MAVEHTQYTCECYRAACMFCDGGLYACTVCGGLEGSVPTECPGRKMSEEELDRVYRKVIDFKDGQWIKLKESDVPT